MELNNLRLSKDTAPMGNNGIGTDIDQMFKTIAGMSTSAFLKEPSGRIIFANESLKRLFFEHENPPGGLSYEALVPELRDISQYTDRNVVRTGQVMRFSYSVRCGDDQFHRFTTVKMPLFEAGSRVGAIFGASYLWQSDDEPSDLLQSLDLKTLTKAYRTLQQIGRPPLRTLDYSCRGLPNKRIARLSNISIRTVENHRKLCKNLLGANSFAEVQQIIASLKEAGLLVGSLESISEASCSEKN